MFRLRFARLGLAGILLSAPAAFGSTIAIIDSGTDIDHPDLSDKIWTNPVDFSPDGRDNDGNGFQDDIHGWNFFANNNSLIDLKYSSLFNDEIEKFFQIQDAFLLGKASEEDLAWVKAKTQDQEFVKHLMTYGTFVHGTHVAGIAAKGNPDARILTVRLVPVENPLLGSSMVHDVIKARDAGVAPSVITKTIIKGGLYLLAGAQGTAFGTVGEYVNSVKADVANASLGTSMVQARMIITPIVKLAMGGKEPDAASIDELAAYFLEQCVKKQSAIATSSPNTLFVFASGNDGTDNDLYPTTPANIGLENTISVGASIENSKIAPFSNYGKKVDVLAPGVGILSSVPDGRHMALTGTSQAAPFVAGLAGRIKDINPALKPADIKKIIIATVDVRDDLKDKVGSAGIVNSDRAVHAAEQSKARSLQESIDDARVNVADLPIEANLSPAHATPFRFFQPQLVLDKAQ